VTVTVYTKPDCVQCEYTKKELDKKGLSYNVIDVTKDAGARKALEDMNLRTMPVVTVEHGTHKEHWMGFRIDKLRGITQDA
jgi:glutaredoxin-like protein NrdH